MLSPPLRAMCGPWRWFIVFSGSRPSWLQGLFDLVGMLGQCHVLSPSNDIWGGVLISLHDNLPFMVWLALSDGFLGCMPVTWLEDIFGPRICTGFLFEIQISLDGVWLGAFLTSEEIGILTTRII